MLDPLLVPSPDSGPDSGPPTTCSSHCNISNFKHIRFSGIQLNGKHTSGNGKLESGLNCQGATVRLFTAPLVQELFRYPRRPCRPQPSQMVSILNGASFGTKGFRAEHLTTDLLNRFISNINVQHEGIAAVETVGQQVDMARVALCLSYWSWHCGYGVVRCLNTVGNTPTTKLSIAPI
jgi:hypothetical protein